MNPKSRQTISSNASATPLDGLLADILRLGNSPISENTVPDLQAFLTKLLDYADSLVPKGPAVDDLADFQETLDELTGVADTLDAACNDYNMADAEDSREEALEAAGEALADLSGPLQDLDSLAEYIPTNEADVAERWGADLERLANLPQGEFRTALDVLPNQTRTLKESATLMSLANESALAKAR
jgi:hypothetical protein